ncbi:nitroreductase family protein [Alkalihalobacterium alkalinitrilicum]|uniref:nitroreductase family protein n=1 Tax=Alkalihalobacterium alkalinitrilicum TaxID=427920 RepID=UPI00099518CC|nr:nitroreductase [Alkalihalobacterium alkalinitrilicum]
MELFDAIKTRRSIGVVKSDPIPIEYIQQILEAGTFAPNHFKTEPWRFFVLTGVSREKLGEVFEEISKSDADNRTNPELIKKIERVKKNPLRAPVIITVGVEPSTKKNVVIQEEYAAVSAAIQNMLLAGHALGLGAIWRTGAICYHKKVSDFFGMSDRGEILGFIYLGFPDMNVPKVKKTSYKDYTTWMT